ncbi:MAG TPA: hypothetical protein VES73_13435 [Lamprocystis sp. (in: g-proteobacteria)]|nr:hypothetical protein [Lamprocystis sp. (in: g-proteobacteria)]
MCNGVPTAPNVPSQPSPSFRKTNTQVAVTEVVPGDLVVLSAGDMIPADGLVLRGQDFFVKQGLPIGEPYPVEKRRGPLPADATERQGFP